MNKLPTMTKEERAWVLYDVANSAFVLVMVTALMPIYFKDVIAASQSAAVSTANWGLANATASLALALLAPVLGAMADYPGRKKVYFVGFLLLGVTFTLTLPLVAPGQWLLCLALFILARVGWAGTNLFYDAFLIDVTKPERMDLISSRGYAWGYIGSVIPFAVILVLLFVAGMDQGLPLAQTRTAFVLVALWWLLFSLPAIRNLRQVHSLPANPEPVRDSFRRLGHVLREVRLRPRVVVFLLAYFFYIDGVDTIISMATAYGLDLGFSPALLIVVLLFIQIVAWPFALLYGRLAHRSSARGLLMVGIGIYGLVTLLAFLLPWMGKGMAQTALFWMIAFLVASSMGGIQALSRSYFARLIPAEQSAEFFGFYNVFGKFAAIVGPLLMAVVSRASGDSRWGVLSLLLLFGLGAWLLNRVETALPSGDSLHGNAPRPRRLEPGRAEGSE